MSQESRLIRLSLLGAVLAGCSHEVVPPSDYTPLAVDLAPGISALPLSDRGDAADTLFTRLDADQTCVEFDNPIDTAHPLKYLYASSMACGGVSVGDVDGDGRPDLFMSSGPEANRLYLQVAPWKFEDQAQSAGVSGGNAWGVGSALVDIDDDGDLDIYVCNYVAPNQLYINQGDGTFAEQARQYGLDIVDACHTPAFCDYDGDGDLDLYLLTNRHYRPVGAL